MQFTQAPRQLRIDKAGQWMWSESGGTNEKYLDTQRKNSLPHVGETGFPAAGQLSPLLALVNFLALPLSGINKLRFSNLFSKNSSIPSHEIP